MADFSVDTAHGCGILTANFKDLSTGNPTSWFWDFGNGQTSNVKNPTVVYSKPGSYTVSLIVSNNSGIDDTIKTNFIQVDSLPVARISYFPQAGCIPLVVHFKDSSYAGSGTITSWNWDFGNGNTSKLQNDSTAYVNQGNYTVKLTVKTSAGCIDSVKIWNAVSTGTKPVPSFFANLFNVCASVPINFTNKTTGAVTSYYWDFGDGDTSTKKGPQHYFQDTGFMNVKLYAFNNGCVDSVEMKNYVYIKPPIVKIRVSFNCDSPYVRNFQAKYLGAKSYTWDFGDGTTSTTAVFPSHTYAAPGAYKVTLYAISDTCDYWDSLTVRIIDETPTYSYVAASPQTCKPYGIKLFAQNYNPNSLSGFSWLYGDGMQSPFDSSSVNNHEYDSAGSFYPLLITQDVLGCYDTISNGTKIDVYGPTASFTSDAITCINYSTTFNDLSVSDGIHPITTWIWDYGDGKKDTSTAAPFFHTYTKTDTFTVRLKVIDSYGCSDTVSNVNSIITLPIPKASFAAFDTTTCFQTAVSFFDKSQGQVFGRLWQFGDGDTSTSVAPVHNYLQTGTYNATLIIGNQTGCSDTAIKTINVLPLPFVDAGIDTTICLGQSIVLQASGASSYKWTSSNSLNCTNCSNPVANPQSTTKYFVTGTDANGCANSDSVVVDVKLPTTLSIQNASDTTCEGRPLQLSIAGAEVYNWQPSTGLSSTTISNPVATPPVGTTVYTVIGSDSKKCFSDTASITVAVGAKPAFDILDTSVIVAAGSYYLIKTSSSPDVVRWSWTPATDLTCTTCPEPQAKGNKIITYTGTAYNVYGCSDTDYITIKGLCNSQVIFIPNTFSPNGDNVNDRFYPRGNGLYLVKSMRIFNRIGQTVFQKNNFAADTESEGWDGTYKGQKLSSDVYIYIIEIICNNGAIVSFKGDVTLLN